MNQEVKAVIGLIVMGASAAVEREFHKNVPDDVQIATTRVPLTAVSYNGVLEMTNQLPAAAKILMGARPDMIMITNMTGSCIRGNEMVNMVQQVTGVPVLVPALEFAKLLGALDCKNIALVSTFAVELNMVERMFFDSRGITIKKLINLQDHFDTDPYAMGYIDYDAILSCVSAQDFSGVDAVIFDHPVMNLGAGIGEKLEKQIHVPLFSINQVLLYAGLTIAGVDTGHLFISKFLEGKGV